MLNIRQKSAELVVAALFFLAGAVVMFDSVRLGARWADDGPQAGYFPFYIGVFICLSAAVNFAIALVTKRDAGRIFVEWDKLRLVLAVLLPAAIYVATVSWIGIYVSSAIFIACFMRWLGRYPWWKVAAVSVGVMVVFFLIFETWFKVPLPKGPLENLLGVG